MTDAQTVDVAAVPVRPAVNRRTPIGGMRYDPASALASATFRMNEVLWVGMQARPARYRWLGESTWMQRTGTVAVGLMSWIRRDLLDFRGPM